MFNQIRHSEKPRENELSAFKYERILSNSPCYLETVYVKLKKLNSDSQKVIDHLFSLLVHEIFIFFRLFSLPKINLREMKVTNYFHDNSRDHPTKVCKYEK